MKKDKKELIDDAVLWEQGAGTAEDDTSEKDTLENGPELDWEAARKHLRAAKKDNSIDRYHKQEQIAQLGSRYNDEERTQELYDAIMAL